MSPPKTRTPATRRATARRRLAAVRHTLGTPVFPLGVLFGLDAVDELDRATFSVLLPDIHDHFGRTAAALSLAGATAIAIVLIEVPLAFLADRRNRVRIATARAAVWQCSRWRLDSRSQSRCSPSPGSVSEAAKPL